MYTTLLGKLQLTREELIRYKESDLERIRSFFYAEGFIKQDVSQNMKEYFLDATMGEACVLSHAKLLLKEDQKIIFEPIYETLIITMDSIRFT